MRTKLLLIVFIISTFAFSANSNENTTKSQIENLQKENESLKKEIEIIKAKSESTSVMIDNVDSMYQNNFNRMTYLFSILGAIIVFVFPFWMQHTQKKLLKIKEEELNTSNTKKINEVLKDFNEKLSESEKKYKEELKKETENLNNTIIEKTEELEQNIIKSNHSLSSRIYLFSAVYYKSNNNYNDYTNSKLYNFYYEYKSGNKNLQEIIKMSNELLEIIKDKNIQITKSSYSLIIFFIKEYDKKRLDSDLDMENPFEKIKDFVNIKKYN
ncbi:hypothetical protein [Empedobacter falsenii]|uniref:Uncharacterized protein n=1 Tax=Empedobacter falsenii TaxID=343874 RepID=A0AAW7DDF6_9FLAO|nr:hypothetical protein [Empedobacter falsenii]MDM1549923.1 hypothetical protein [Empedobacter falsenii]